ncbi:MAG: imidazolonepropionase [Halobacteriovoraceae bacterium]|nr:imidazolonepropionase [Halobacteriovoraceae bacterium]
MKPNIWKNFNQVATFKTAFQKDGRNLQEDDLDLIDDGSVVFDGKILWVGKSDEIPSQYKDGKIRDCQGMVLLPELVDSHTHLVFGGDRSEEYALRLNGGDYQKIAQSGGGILATARSTNRLTYKEMFDICVSRIERINSYGIGTIEIKSGYGLNIKKEEELSCLIYDLKKHFAPKVNIFNTFMAAHAVPEEFTSSADYMKKVISLLADLHKKRVVDCVDIFHEKGYFSREDVENLFSKAQKMGIPRKIHADEFYDNGGALLACKYNALSADHLLATGESGIKTLANSQTVATLLPGTGLFLGKKPANARKLLNAGCRVAIGSDYNPGSCHCDNLLLLASVAAPMYGLNMAQLWAAITLNAAAALGLKKQGALIPGMDARFSLFKTDSLAQITYNWGINFSCD